VSPGLCQIKCKTHRYWMQACSIWWNMMWMDTVMPNTNRFCRCFQWYPMQKECGLKYAFHHVPNAWYLKYFAWWLMIPFSRTQYALNIWICCDTWNNSIETWKLSISWNWLLKKILNAWYWKTSSLEWQASSAYLIVWLQHLKLLKYTVLFPPEMIGKLKSLLFWDIFNKYITN